ncbi:rhodanese-like domain-containing protein [Desulfovibrio litoralis]|uniref:Rhodanese-related sulfurtransferase n=1 Tax=Desulfovibrio litoralis DSM 11393 TaxID=1121455 RepID=A0A1M7THW8_9BACT|nr:rhodanese-like domain-containing protein [Desulfovibrio litoralis]SHN70271.1 Rhodanese-related sulfurtransferase [Desulfovibrio litoralis DSM 11393]
MTSINTITPQELKNKDLYQDVILDVRTYREYSERRLKTDHYFMPLDSLDPYELLLKRGLLKDTEIYCLCVSGARAKKAATKLAEAGFRNLYIVEGGIGACEQAGFEVVNNTGKSQVVQGGMSLDRQVYITVGTIVTISVFLGNLFNCLFNYFAFAIGAGLIFAGLTNRCGLAFLLSKAPWNKQTVETVSAGGACSGGGASSKSTNNTPPPSKNNNQSCQ